jgi:para-aminobenzoate synthetase/4-amino-4-deoxychorismate lyase
MFTARFDDLRPNRRRSFSLPETESALVADHPGEVRAVLEAAEEAVTAGKWVAGWVAYEAAPGLGREFATVPSTNGLPLVWFGVFEERSQAERSTGTYQIGDWSPTEDAAAHRAAVQTVRGHIRAGRTYQVNHTFRLSAPFEGDAATFYDDLAHSQAGGYAGFVDAGDWVIASASPEAFFEMHGRHIMTKPMKGTAARGTTTDDDGARRSALLTS